MSMQHLVTRHYYKFVKRTDGTFNAIQGMKRHVAKFLF